jgi:VWFA-related protein
VFYWCIEVDGQTKYSRRDILGSGAMLLACARLLPAAPEPTFSSDVKVVNVFATVRNKHGEIIRDLTKDDFLLDEDGRTQTIRYFSQETDLPLTLGLLVDTSMSQRRVLGEERSASYRFLSQVLREDKDKAFVIHFDREVELLQDLTSSRKSLEAALGELDVPQRSTRGWAGPGGRGGRGFGGGGTALYDSILLASDELMKKQQGRKAVILLSDGVDHGSRTSLSTAIESAQRADTLVYSILFADPAMNNFGGFGGAGRNGRRGGRSRMPVARPDGKKVLERAAKETGGGFFEVSKKHTIEQIYDTIQQELRNQYSLGYTPEAGAAAGYRKIRVATKKKDLVVQAREGYYPGA